MKETRQEADLAEVLEVAAEAGHILLENGAEISRVEDIMSRIASHFGVDSGSFFVLSNGIFTTGSVPLEPLSALVILDLLLTTQTLFSSVSSPLLPI